MGSFTICFTLVGVCDAGLCFLVGGLLSGPLLGCLRAEVGCTLLDRASGVLGVAAFIFGRMAVSEASPAGQSEKVKALLCKVAFSQACTSTRSAHLQVQARVFAELGLA